MEIYSRNVADRMDEKGKTWKGGGLFQQDHMGGGAGVQEDALRRQEPRRTKTASAAMAAAPRALLRDGRDVRTENGSHGKSAKKPCHKIMERHKIQGQNWPSIWLNVPILRAKAARIGKMKTLPHTEPF